MRAKIAWKAGFGEAARMLKKAEAMLLRVFARGIMHRRCSVFDDVFDSVLDNAVPRNRESAKKEKGMKSMLRKRLAALVAAAAMLLAGAVATQTASAATSDAGNTAGAAKSIAVNTNVTDNIANDNDEDWFKYTIPAKGKVQISLAFAPTSDNAYSVDVYTSPGGTSASNSYEFGQGTSGKSTVYRLPAGSYFVRVSTTYSTPTTNYTLKVSYTNEGKTDTEVEPNDSMEHATAINTNKSYKANLSSPSYTNDTDWFKYTIPAKGKVSVGLTFAATNSSAYGVTFYSVSNSAATSRDYSMGSGTSGSTDTYRLPAGTYYVQVSNGWNTPDSDYTIKVNYTNESSVNTEVEPNDDAGSATPIALNKAYKANFSTSNDDDWYKYTLTASTQLSIAMTFGQAVSDAPYNLYVYKASGSTSSDAQDWYNFGNGTGVNTPVYTLPKGTYYLHVIGYTASTIDYTIMARTITSVPVYRVYNKNSGLHHYTTDLNEKNGLVRRGWKYEGVSFNAAKQNSASGLQPVYREYNPHDGNHNWTLNKTEHDKLVSLGWHNEGVAWYTDPLGTVTVYRLYNHHNGEHLYTTDAGEYWSLGNYGWNQEGTAWKGL
jgi:hypothetical protein